MTTKDIQWMYLALEEAKKAYSLGEVPVGAILVANNVLLGKAHNLVESKQLIFFHAESLLLDASYSTKIPYSEMTLYSTLEPCTMCFALLLQKGVGRLVYGAKSPRFGALHLFESLFEEKPPIEITSSILEAECGLLLKTFFQQRRSPSNPLLNL